MKWLIIQSDGEHKGQDGWDRNDMMRECHAVKHGLIYAGDHVDIWGLRHTNYRNPPDFNGYDGIFVLENYDFSWIPDISRYGRAIRLFWLIDAHWQPIDTFSRLIPQCDIVLHSTRAFMEPYQQRYPHQRHAYFPNSVDSRFFDKNLYVDQHRENNVIFIGGKAAPRAAAIDLMTIKCGMTYSYGITGMSYVRAVLNTKIQFNKGLNGDINYRNWETIGLGACLLTEYDPEMELLGFKHDVNCLFYKTPEEAVDLANSYIASGEWQRIAEAGYALSRYHTCIRRIATLVRQLTSETLCLKTVWNTPIPSSKSTSPEPVTP